MISLSSHDALVNHWRPAGDGLSWRREEQAESRAATDTISIAQMPGSLCLDARYAGTVPRALPRQFDGEGGDDRAGMVNS